MAKTFPFRAFNPTTKRYHAVPGVEKISKIRLNKAEWTANPRPTTAKGGKRTKKATPGTKPPKTPTRAIDAVRYTLPEVACLHCGLPGNDRACKAKCYDDFVETILIHPRIDIIGPGRLGYGVFTAAKTRIEKGEWLEEYVGDIRPLDAASGSLYQFEVPDKCDIDADKAGNWTRFINSSCKPNVKAWAETVGKRHVIVFQALKNIGPGEELVFNYGGKYFEKAGFLCKCDAQDEPHMPKGGKKPVKPVADEAKES